MALEERSYDHLLKILLVGDSGVGSTRLFASCSVLSLTAECAETNLLLSFSGADFDQNVRATIGVDLKIKILQCKKLWMTLGVVDPHWGVIDPHCGDTGQ